MQRSIHRKLFREFEYERVKYISYTENSENTRRIYIEIHNSQGTEKAERQAGSGFYIPLFTPNLLFYTVFTCFLVIYTPKFPLYLYFTSFTSYYLLVVLLYHPKTLALSIFHLIHFLLHFSSTTFSPYYTSHIHYLRNSYLTYISLISLNPPKYIKLCKLIFFNA